MAQIFPYINVTFEDYNKFLDLDTQLNIDNSTAETNLEKLLTDIGDPTKSLYKQKWDDIKYSYFGMEKTVNKKGIPLERLSFVDMGIIWILSTSDFSIDYSTYDPPYGIGSCNTVNHQHDFYQGKYDYREWCNELQNIVLKSDPSYGTTKMPKYPGDLKKSCNIYNTNYCSSYTLQNTCEEGGCNWDGNKCNKMDDGCKDITHKWNCDAHRGCTWTGDYHPGNFCETTSVEEDKFECKWVSFYETQKDKDPNMDKDYNRGGCASCVAALAAGAQEDFVAAPGTTKAITSFVWDIYHECSANPHPTICFSGGPFQTSSAYLPPSGSNSYTCPLCEATECGKVLPDGTAEGGLQNPLCAAKMAHSYANLCTTNTEGDGLGRCTWSKSWGNYDWVTPPPLSPIEYKITGLTISENSIIINYKLVCPKKYEYDPVEKKCVAKYFNNFCSVERLNSGIDGNCISGNMPLTTLGWNSPPCEHLYRAGGPANENYPFCTLSIWAARAAKYTIYRALVKLNKITLANNFKNKCDVENKVFNEACKDHMDLESIQKNKYDNGPMGFPIFCPGGNTCQTGVRSCYCNQVGSPPVPCYTK
jgi:hypothetical protein